MKNTTIKSTAVQIEYESDKLEALRVYLNDKNSTVEQELLETLDSIYKKVVPTQVRDFIERKNAPLTPPVVVEPSEN